MKPHIATLGKRDENGTTVESYLEEKLSFTMRHNALSTVEWKTEAGQPTKLAAIRDFLSIYSNKGIVITPDSADELDSVDELLLEKIPELKGSYARVTVVTPQALAGFYDNNMFCTIREKMLRPVMDCVLATSAPTPLDAQLAQLSSLYAQLQVAYAIR